MTRLTIGMRRLADPFGGFLPALLVHDIRDRLGGARERADARWGRTVRASGHRSIWIACSARRDSVRLGCELALAIAGRRRDAATTLTFEAAFPDLIESLAEQPRIRAGYAPADHAVSLNAFLARDELLGVVIAGMVPRPNLLRICAHVGHALLVAPPAPVPGVFERTYPRPGLPSVDSGAAPASEFETLLAPSTEPPAAPPPQADARRRRLWWWHGDDPEALRRFVAVFRGYLPADALIASGAACAPITADAPGVQPLGSWITSPRPDATLLPLDQRKLMPVWAASVTGVHFANPEPELLWPALAGGAATSAAGRVDIANPRVSSVVALMEDEAAIVRAWSRLRADRAAHELASGVARRAFAQERRAAEAVLAELLERVERWR